MPIAIADNSAIDQWRQSTMPATVTTLLQDMYLSPVNFQELLLMTNPLSRKSRIDFLYSKAADRILEDAATIEDLEIKCLVAGTAPAPLPTAAIVCAPNSSWVAEWTEVRTKANEPIPPATTSSIQSFKDGQRWEILFFAAVLSNLARIKRTATLADFGTIQGRLRPLSEQQLVAEVPIKTDRAILSWIEPRKNEWATIATYRHLISRGCSPQQIEGISQTLLETTGCWLSHRYLMEIARDFIAGQCRVPEGGDAFDTRQVLYFPHVDTFVTKDGYSKTVLKKILPPALNGRLVTF